MNHVELSKSIAASPPALIPYLTAGYPDLETFANDLDDLTSMSPAVEIGVPFSDPMADGATIQESSRIALAGGTTLRDVVALLTDRPSRDDVPLIMMSYLNPLLAFGVADLMPELAQGGVAALVVPDLPFEESHLLTKHSTPHGIGLVQLVTPLTAPDRLEILCRESKGFVYAVTMAGTTGSTEIDTESVSVYLDRVSAMSSIPVIAGFGVRTRENVNQLSAHCDGVIVASAIIEAIDNKERPADFVRSLQK